MLATCECKTIVDMCQEDVPHARDTYILSSMLHPGVRGEEEERNSAGLTPYFGAKSSDFIRGHETALRGGEENARSAAVTFSQLVRGH